MSFVCSDSCENSITREKVLAKGSGNHLFSRLKLSISPRSTVPKRCSGIFSVSDKCLDKHVEQLEDDGRKSGGFRGFGLDLPSVFKGGWPIDRPNLEN